MVVNTHILGGTRHNLVTKQTTYSRFQRSQTLAHSSRFHPIE